VTVTWEVRLLFLQAALVLAGFGMAWMRDLPRYRSLWGLRFSAAMASEEIWRKVHRNAGWVIVTAAAWLALPFQTLESTLCWQIPGFAFLSCAGIGFVRYRIGN
jgi:hypothetical protein